jgi:hypothetical protein
MRLATTLLAAATILTLAHTGATAQAPSGFEGEPVLKATDLAAADVLKGPRHHVSDRVPVQGMLARFAIQSDLGTFEAHGIHMLQVRVREVYALGELEKTSKSKEFAAAAGKAAVRPVTSAANMLMNPADTVKGLPGGATRMFERAKLGGAAVVEAASGSGKTGGEKASDVTERVGSITVDVLGFEKERRDLAKSLGVDPYTTNPVLAQKLTDMAWVAFSGRFAIQTVTSVVVPGSMIMSAVTITNTAVYDTPPGDLLNNAIAVFKETGASEGQVNALVKNKQYSLSVLTALAAGIQRLKGAAGLPSLVGFAATARTEDEARVVAGAANMLARYHEAVERVAQVTAPGPIIGRTASGALIVAAPVDYVAWTERIARAADRDDLKAPRRVVWLSGRMSPRARKEFTQRGWTVEESFTVAAER